MKQVPTDKYNIAWFKLAEYVARGEKERALGVYRLLSHSFDDVAFARQLEGDILWAFNDSAASHKYCQAAQLYQDDHRVLQAAAVYEHLITLHPTSIAYVSHIIDLYMQLSNASKVASYLAVLSDLVLGITQEKNVAKDFVMQQVTALLDRLMVAQDAPPLLNRFLAQLQEIHPYYYQIACQHIEGKK